MELHQCPAGTARRIVVPDASSGETILDSLYGFKERKKICLAISNIEKETKMGKVMC